jgi:hypothetical protein
MSSLRRPNPSDPDPEQIAVYKALLRDVLDRRPSGTRQRLASALGKNRSFVSQITSPGYDVPIPAQHIAKIFEVCHLAPAERAQFLEAYRRAHPRRLMQLASSPRSRVLVLAVPDLGAVANRVFDARLRSLAAELAEDVAAEP